MRFPVLTLLLVAALTPQLLQAQTARNDLYLIRDFPRAPGSVDLMFNDLNVGNSTVQLGQGPQYAQSFSLQADGSFDYTPTAGMVQDSFSYLLPNNSMGIVRLVRAAFALGQPSPQISVRPRGAIVGDQAFIFGGTGDYAATTLVNTIYRCDLNFGGPSNWTQLVDMPATAGKYGMALDSIGNLIYSVGGKHAGGITGQAWVYDIATNTWSENDPLPGGAQLLNCYGVAIGGKLYVFGGVTALNVPNALTYIFDPAATAGSRWSSVAGPNADLANPSAIAINGRILVEGSNMAQNACSAHSFNPATNTWTQLSTPNQVGPFAALYNLVGIPLRLGAGTYFNTPPDVYGLVHRFDEFLSGGTWNLNKFSNFMNNAPNTEWAFDSTDKWLIKSGGANEYRQASGTTEVMLLPATAPPPAALPDEYVTFAGYKLQVASPGVLANDIDYKGAGLTGVLNANGPGGTATVNTTGGTTYLSNTPGVRSFTYRAKDALNQLSSPATVQVTVQPNVATLTAPTTVVSGQSFEATITLESAALGSGLTISLGDDSSALTIPTSKFFAAGATTANVTVATSPITATATRNILAWTGNKALSRPVRLIPIPKLLTFGLSTNSVLAGEDLIGTLTLKSEAAPGGSTASVADSSSAITTPATVGVPAGATTAQFTIGTSVVTATYTRAITAALGGVSRTASLTLNPLLTSVTLNPSSVKGGVSTTGTVTLFTSAGPGGETVTLSDNSGNITVPATVQVAAGATTAQFTVATTKVSATFTRAIYADNRGCRRTALLTLTP